MYVSNIQISELVEALKAEGVTLEEFTLLIQNQDGVLTDLKQILSGLVEKINEDFRLACDEPFSPEDFIEPGWTIWKGPVDGEGLEGEENPNTREDNLSVINWGEEIITGGDTSLGGKAFLSLWDDYQVRSENSVLDRLVYRRGVYSIRFQGLHLRDPSGTRRVLCLYVNCSKWFWALPTAK